MKASIISIGDEILIGQIINTNSSWIADKLSFVGIEVTDMLTVSDKREEIINALNRYSEPGYVFVTGGLGPTKDDITKEAICEFFGSSLITDDAALRKIKEYVVSRGGSLNELNRKQAEVPHNCIVFHNEYGTAPGMLLEKANVKFFFMPGVPYEMQYIMETGVLPHIKKEDENNFLFRTILTQGVAESVLSDKLSEWEERLPTNISLAYLPSPGMVRLRINIYGLEKKHAGEIMKEKISEIEALISEYIFGFDNDTLPAIIGRMFVQQGKTLAVAESCSGGDIAHNITLIPGSSGYFTGGVVAYDNSVKTNLLNVPEQIITQYGVVSKKVVEAMAAGALKLFSSDYAVATSGIAGPDGGTPEKPVGTVWIAVASEKGVISQKYLFGERRESNITKTTLTALNMLRKFMFGNYLRQKEQ